MPPAEDEFDWLDNVPKDTLDEARLILGDILTRQAMREEPTRIAIRRPGPYSATLQQEEALVNLRQSVAALLAERGVIRNWEVDSTLGWLKIEADEEVVRRTKAAIELRREGGRVVPGKKPSTGSEPRLLPREAGRRPSQLSIEAPPRPRPTPAASAGGNLGELRSAPIEKTAQPSLIVPILFGVAVAAGILAFKFEPTSTWIRSRLPFHFDGAHDARPSAQPMPAGTAPRAVRDSNFTMTEILHAGQSAEMFAGDLVISVKAVEVGGRPAHGMVTAKIVMRGYPDQALDQVGVGYSVELKGRQAFLVKVMELDPTSARFLVERIPPRP